MPHEQNIPTCQFCAGDCPVGYGYCHCGCGEKTSIHTKTDRSKRRQLIKGKPKYIINGHQRTIRPLIEDASPFKMDGVYCRLIALSRGYHCIVWESDYKWLMQWKWFAHLSKDGQIYARRGVRLSGKHYMLDMHRVLLNLDYGDDGISDHRNGVTLDNRRTNLRIATHAQNSANQKLRSDNTSGCKGVSWNHRRQSWSAVIRFGNIKYFLGDFKSKIYAQDAYEKAAIQYHKEFMRGK